MISALLLQSLILSLAYILITLWRKQRNQNGIKRSVAVDSLKQEEPVDLIFRCSNADCSATLDS